MVDQGDALLMFSLRRLQHIEFQLWNLVTSRDVAQDGSIVRRDIALFCLLHAVYEEK